MAEQKKRAREARANIDAGWAGDVLSMIDKSKATERNYGYENQNENFMRNFSGVYADFPCRL